MIQLHTRASSQGLAFRRGIDMLSAKFFVDGATPLGLHLHYVTLRYITLHYVKLHDPHIPRMLGD